VKCGKIKYSGFKNLEVGFPVPVVEQTYDLSQLGKFEVISGKIKGRYMKLDLLCFSTYPLGRSKGRF